MSRNSPYYNHEGYPDPTVFAAFNNIEAELRKARFRPIVYVCSPYSGDINANILNARRYCRFAVDSGSSPSRRTCCSPNS